MGLEADFKDSQTLAWGVEPSQCDGLGSGAMGRGIFFGSSRGEGWSGSRWVGRGGRRVLTFFLYFA